MTQNKKEQGKLPLSGIRVIDFSRLLPGPWATQMLGEMGAEVIKVEQPGIGDPSRHSGPLYKKNSVYFNAVNANKRSIVLDLSKEQGRAIVHKLLRDVDVAVESFRPGVARKLGMDYATLRALNPRLIYCSISGLGQSGPLSHVAGHDLILQALTGLMGCGLEEVNPPQVPGFQSADYAAALYAIIGILAALAQRASSGVGCEIDVGMFDSLFNMCMVALSPVFAGMANGVTEGADQARMEVFGSNPRYSTYLSKDGKPVAVTLLETKIWTQFCNHIGRPDLVVHDESPAERLSTHNKHNAAYRKALADYCASYTWAEMMQHMEKTGIAICPVCTPAEAARLEQVKARGLIGQVDDPVEGHIPQLVNPLARAGLARTAHCPAPQLGEHSAEILSGLGYSREEIEGFRKGGII